MNRVKTLIIIIAAAASTACAPLIIGAAAGGAVAAGAGSKQVSGKVYAEGGTLRAGTAAEAVVVSVRNVQIVMTPDSSKRGVGVAGGGIAGGAAGKAIGGDGDGGKIGAALGAIAGALGGDMITKRTSNAVGQEIVLRVAGRKDLVVVTQADSDFKAGEKVLLTSVGKDIRVARYGG